MISPRVTVIGAGVAGLVSALELAGRGLSVEVIERGSRIGERSCSWFAGGMLAPWCEQVNAEPEVSTLGRIALDWWPRHFPATMRNGTLVVAPPRDTGELVHFARQTERFEWAGADRIGELEPDLAGRFRKALFFAEEAHLAPRQALTALAERLAGMGVPIRFGIDASPASIDTDHVLDCRGFAARDTLTELRGVRGEMAIVRSKEIALSRPVRLLHPRFPLYVVPRADGLFMIGATMIESASSGPVTARSAVELLNGAYALHPAFGEAEIVEFGVDVRPAFANNLPRLIRRDHTTYLNGLYRHGFLLAPALAQQAATALCGLSPGELT
ncbi:MAG: FAD-dependent oxidoreductase [Rhodanobacter sp.]|nr:MAG: FAD-dependent oxidoreductase [Rhodanobacter sp.]